MHPRNRTHTDAEALASILVDHGREGGPRAARDFIDHGGFDLIGYVSSFEADWRLGFFHPVAFFRHVKWKRKDCDLTPGSPDFWRALGEAERNLAVAEFGPAKIDFAERVRLRLIRQAHHLSWWKLRSLIGSLSAKCVNQKLEVRRPPRHLLRVFSWLRQGWLVLTCYLLAWAVLRFATRGCLDCSIMGVVVLLPCLLVVGWALHVVSKGWLSSFNQLKEMSLCL